MVPSLNDLLGLLDRWSEWKRMRQSPSRIDELEKRVATLEAALTTTPGRVCDACGARGLRRTSREPDDILGAVGVYREIWTCSSCGATTAKTSK